MKTQSWQRAGQDAAPASASTITATLHGDRATSGSSVRRQPLFKLELPFTKLICFPTALTRGPVSSLLKRNHQQTQEPGPVCLDLSQLLS